MPFAKTLRQLQEYVNKNHRRQHSADSFKRAGFISGVLCLPAFVALSRISRFLTLVRTPLTGSLFGTLYNVPLRPLLITLSHPWYSFKEPLFIARQPQPHASGCGIAHCSAPEALNKTTAKQVSASVLHCPREVPGGADEPRQAS